jgi:UrcA family protein
MTVLTNRTQLCLVWRLQVEQLDRAERSIVMIKFVFGRIAPTCLLAAAATLVTPLQAQRTSIAVRHVNLHPGTSAEARRTFAKIDDAALRACGASGFSLAEAKAAMRASPCWQEAVGDAVRQSGDPLLAETFARHTVTPR